MKASELIAALQAEIAKHGDLPIIAYRPGSYTRVIESNSVEVWFADKEETEPSSFMVTHTHSLNEFQKEALKNQLDAIDTKGKW